MQGLCNPAVIDIMPVLEHSSTAACLPPGKPVPAPYSLLLDWIVLWLSGLLLASSQLTADCCSLPVACWLALPVQKEVAGLRRALEISRSNEEELGKKARACEKAVESMVRWCEGAWQLEGLESPGQGAGLQPLGWAVSPSTCHRRACCAVCLPCPTPTTLGPAFTAATLPVPLLALLPPGRWLSWR